ncbi:hypothetical protein EEJ42_24135 [Streptomyces botrytidirepellens]|uniref:Uncharacterized protein n=1 Tax=Streptomyces botrytidirepellens TaxID=2486417 RepID=A0A3M8VV56_9ACTN|nr:hypothetical protein EEJ42_24135 [Streptomyces botrytidirepellens]
MQTGPRRRAPTPQPPRQPVLVHPLPHLPQRPRGRLPLLTRRPRAAWHSRRGTGHRRRVGRSRWLRAAFLATSAVEVVALLVPPRGMPSPRRLTDGQVTQP